MCVRGSSPSPREPDLSLPCTLYSSCQSHSLFSFSTSIIFRFHSSKVGMSSGSLQLRVGSESEAAGELKSCQTQGGRSALGGLLGWTQLTPCAGFTLWDVLASLCCELGAAGELGGGSDWLLVPVVWTLEVFSRTIGGLLWEQDGAFSLMFFI